MVEWWRSGRETGDRYERADAAYDESIRLAHAGKYVEAEAAAIAAARAYREVLDQTGFTEAKRRLAKALWRQATAVLLAKSAERALEPGLEGIELGRQALDATPADHPALDDMVREVAICMNDVAQIAGRAGRLELYKKLLTDAHETSLRSNGPAAKQALGTSLHNLAVWAHEMMQLHGPENPEKAFASVELGLHMLKSAVQIREALSAHGDPLSRWELVNSLALEGELQCYQGDVGGLRTLERALGMLEDAPGQAFQGLREKVARKHGDLRQMLVTRLHRVEAARGNADRGNADRVCPCGSGRTFAQCHGVT